MTKRISVEQMPEVENEEQMRHLVRYVNFINSRPERDLKRDGKLFNIHHIIPKSLSGESAKNNLIKLTLREHFFAHTILFYCGYKKMISAYWFMVSKFGSKTSKTYEKAVFEYKKYQSDRVSGCIWINNKIEEKLIEQKDFYLFSDYSVGRIKREEYAKRYDWDKIWIFKENEEILCERKDVEERIKMGFSFGRVKFSEERCEKMANGKKGMIRINRNGEIKTIHKNELDFYLNNGWVLGSNLKTTKNKIRMSKDEKLIYVSQSDVNTFKKNGYVEGYNNQTFPKHIKKVMCLENGKTYLSTGEALKDFKEVVSISTIHKSLKTGKTIKNYTFVYVE